MLYPSLIFLSTGRKDSIKIEVVKCCFIKTTAEQHEPSKKKKVNFVSPSSDLLDQTVGGGPFIFILNHPIHFLEPTWHGTHACVQLLSFGWLNSGVWFGISFIKHDFLHISACFRSNVCSWMDYEFLSHLKHISW